MQSNGRHYHLPDECYVQLFQISGETTTLSLSDWYRTPAKQLGFPWSGGPSSDLAIISVEEGDFIFSIEGHNATIIEVDGVNHVPYTVDEIRIYAEGVGQRYSFVAGSVLPSLTADQAAANCWIRAMPSVGTVEFTAWFTGDWERQLCAEARFRIQLTMLSMKDFGGDVHGQRNPVHCSHYTSPSANPEWGLRMTYLRVLCSLFLRIRLSSSRCLEGLLVEG
ncbi:hypothetical protein DFS33DRAFT_1275201 [Desarmillaria ectypa]|nr:hypothetical protein DFS33DRAFT_1275201 [Desarmillaria ectypa]